ncbi:Carboxy-terminal domain (CTD) phosphatase [Dissophora globulifera]|uniref:RNA polymerase II subunit A C-terminal domain phosphatase n=1 Tax=Dissophora globulifera TaxID=979702 RepID=A0A9P6R7J5_9FUNG|nr:Carboxy-terminal domain (CTD) phosphatase [Dissophora globulifera]
MADNEIKHYIPAAYLPATIIAVRTSENRTQSEGDELIEYEYTEQVKGFVEEGETSTHARRAEIRATKDGIVGVIHVKKGDIISDGSKIVMEYKGCDHDIQHEGMCVECCKTVPKDSKSHVNMTHDATSLSVSRTEAKRLEQDTVDRLLKEGKLSLIVDLDQTLIHATVGAAIDEWVNAQGEMPKDIRMFPLPDSPTPYYIKLRPHLETFLKKVTSLYELHIYTMGTRNYAAAVANVIDPDGKFFSQRILSRDENSSMTQKTIERLFPCDTSMVVVIDDRADVWQYSPNLVKVHPYEYFVGAGDINAKHLPKQDATTNVASASPPKAAEPSSSTPETTTPKSDPSDPSPLSEVSPATEALPSADSSTTPSPNTPPSARPTKTEDGSKAKKPMAPVMDDNDNDLKHILEILETIHERFYDAREQFIQKESKRPADVKAIIHDTKRSVLKGVNILFSSVIPLGQAPERTDIWRQAHSFGAECSHDLNSRVTHVVAAKPGTAKVMRARQRKHIKIVRPEWLFHSVRKWQRQDESQFLLEGAIKPLPPSTTPPPPQTDGEEDTGLEEEEDQGGISEGMDENHRPLSIDKDEINEHLKSVNWDDMDKEVEDFVGDLDDTDFDSDTSTRSNPQSDASTDGNKSPLVNLKRARIPRRSGLGATVTYGSSDDEEEDNGSTAGDVHMSGLENRDDGTSSDDSGGDIDEESGSDAEDEDSAGGSDSDRPSRRRVKRPRHDTKKRGFGSPLGVGGDDEELDMDADDETTMDHTRTLAGSRSEREEEEEDEEGEEDDDDDFLNDLENDIDAQLNEDDEE